MIVHHNNTIIHIIDGPKPALRYEEIHKAIQPGDTFMMKCELFIKENAVPTDVICEVEVKKVYHNWCELKVIEEKKKSFTARKRRGLSG